MDWGDTLSTLAVQGASALATAFGGPLAGEAVKFVGNKILGKPDASPEEVKQALQGLSGDQIVQLKKLDLDFRAHLAEMGINLQIERIKADSANLQSVNATMQTEAKADHWPTYTWRPFIGFVFGVMVMADYFVLPLAHVDPPIIPVEVWYAFGAVLGVASWYRGKMQADPNVPTDNRG